MLLSGYLLIVESVLFIANLAPQPLIRKLIFLYIFFIVNIFIAILRVMPTINFSVQGWDMPMELITASMLLVSKNNI